MITSRVWLVALILMLSTAAVQGGEASPRLPDAAEEVAPAEPVAVPASQVWIVVNLFSGRTSKQAVKVRDTFVGLGAQGQGIILPYSEVTVENMARLRPSFLALSPNGIPWCRYAGRDRTDLRNFLQALRVIIEDMNIPVIGICGGHQALALAFGGKVGPIRGGEDDCFAYGHNPTERGRHNVQILQNDPLFAGMNRTINLVQNHYDEVKRLPEGFINLAKNDLGQYQIIRHPIRPAYGVQAHTEYYLNARPDGGMLLRNFLAIVRTHNNVARRGLGTDDQGPTATRRKHAPGERMF